MNQRPFLVLGLILGLIFTADIYLFSFFSGFLVLSAVLIQVGSSITGFIIMKHRDAGIFFFIEAEYSKKKPIVREVWVEAILVFSCYCLIIPGIFSNFLGVMMLQQPVRNWILDTFFYEAL